MTGELPTDFLRFNSTPQQQQTYADERVAQILQAQQQAGFMPIPANVRGRLNVSLVQVSLEFNYCNETQVSSQVMFSFYKRLTS